MMPVTQEQTCVPGREQVGEGDFSASEGDFSAGETR